MMTMMLVVNRIVSYGDGCDEYDVHDDGDHVVFLSMMVVATS